MIIIASKPGQLGNLLIVYSAFLAYSLEHRIKIVNPSFHQYKRYFTGTRYDPAGARSFKWLYSLARAVIRCRFRNRLISAIELDWNEKVELDKENIPEIRSAISFVQGWQYRANTLLRKHGDRIRDHFTPVPVFRDLVESFFKKLPASALIVGVHIRRGDYRKFENGKYFYSFDEYAAVMSRVSSLLSNKEHIFMLSSNEEIPMENFSGFTTVKAPGNELTDLYALAACSYIVGPPSTYSMWASFYGKVPLCMIHAADQEITLKNFTIQETF